jgi:hypothetical protein
VAELVRRSVDREGATNLSKAHDEHLGDAFE